MVFESPRKSSASSLSSGKRRARGSRESFLAALSKDLWSCIKPIASFQLVQEAIARMEAEIEAIRWLVYYVSDLKTKGLRHAKEISSAKWLATELAVRVSAEAIRLHGAYGCTDDFPVAHHYRDAVLSTILGGTTEIHKLTIGRELLGINAMV